jgi:ATP synthase protein I
MTALAFPGVFRAFRQIFGDAHRPGYFLSFGVGGPPMGDDDLNKRIAKAQAELDAQARPSKNAMNGPGMGLGFRMAADFVAAILVGAVLGWGIDAIFGTTPWGLIAFLMLGFITGVWNVVRTAQAANKASAPPDGKS